MFLKAIGTLGGLKRGVTVLLLLVILTEGALIWYQSGALRVERERSSVLNQEIYAMEQSIILTERLQKYSGELVEAHVNNTTALRRANA